MSDLQARICKVLDDGKAVDVVSINLEGKSDIADVMVIASGTSSRHVIALADQLYKDLKESDEDIFSVEGGDVGDWVVVDAGDVIVHIFQPEIRELYALEKMWSMALPAASN